jgi:hypothetical protein
MLPSSSPLNTTNNPYSQPQYGPLPGLGMNPYPSPTANEGGSTLAATSTYDPVAAQAAAQKAAEQNLVNQMFDTKVAGLQSQYDSLAPQEQSAQLGISNQFTTKSNDLSTARAQGDRNLNMSRNQVNEYRARSLKDIRDNLLNQSMSYNNQLGAFGAGDSSAASQIQRALSGLASKNRGNVVSDASNQETQINIKQEDLATAFQQNMRDLNAWRQNSLAELANKFMTQRQQIQQAMSQADVDRAQQLAQYDQSQTQVAIERLANLENMYRTQATQISDFYKNYFAPKDISIAPELQQYQVNPISAGELRNLGSVKPVAENPNTAAIRKFEEEQQKSSILGY